MKGSLSSVLPPKIVLGIVALACLASPASALTPHATLAYSRDAAEFLKHYHAEAIRTPDNFVHRKFALMSDSPIGFFRGSAHLFYRDLSEHPALKSPVIIPLVGDVHLENVSAFKLSRGLGTFDLDDFDEAVEGPYTWEVLRVLVSIRLFAREANFSKAATERIVNRFLSGYLTRLEDFSKNPGTLKSPVVESMVPGPAAGAIQRVNKQNLLKERKRWIRGGRIVRKKKLIPVNFQTMKGLHVSIEAYAEQRHEPVGFFRVKDAVRRVAGLASLSKQRFLLLVEGKSAADSDDFLLELKEQSASAAVPYLSARPGNQAERVRKAWEYFVPDADQFLGTASAGDSHYLVRSFPLLRSEVDVDTLETELEFSQFIDTVALLVTRAHARSGRGRDILNDAGGISAITKRLSGFSEAYARQIESDREIWKTYIDP
ncbi:MAG: DUF2252 family protein [Candidatus Sericytochromatia bacterium]|nr:DUF2252 family protein [Candidatus Sericytochromatia bacterium]